MSQSTLDPNSIFEVQRLRKLRDAKLKERNLKQAYGLDHYRPHLKQHRFHSEGTCIGRYCRFGNRTGKTVCGAAEDVSWLLGERSFYKYKFEIKGRRVAEGRELVWEDYVAGFHDGSPTHPLVTSGIPQRPVKGLLIVSDWDKAKEIFTNRQGSYENLGELFQLIPHEALGKPHTSRGGHIDMIPVKRKPEHGGGESLLYIDTVESWKHASLSAESSDHDFVHYDEPPPHDMFLANARGLADRQGKFWINATPVTEQWVNDEFCPPNRTNVKIADEGIRFRKTAKAGDRFIITASIFENPYISDAGRNEFEATLNSEQKECRLMGLPLNLAGLIYKEFVYDLHVLTAIPQGWEDYHLPPKSYCFRNAWDVHDAIPQAILFVATAPTGEAFIYDELFFDKLIQPNAELVREKLAGRFCADYIIDPRSIIESPVDGTSILDKLFEYELYYEPGSKDMMGGISATREKLKERRPSGAPTIYVTPNCTTFLWEIMRYAYNPKTHKPIDKDDHMMENFRRLVLNGLQYMAPSSEFVPRRPTVIGYHEDK